MQVREASLLPLWTASWSELLLEGHFLSRAHLPLCSQALGLCPPWLPSPTAQPGPQHHLPWKSQGPGWGQRRQEMRNGCSFLTQRLLSESDPEIWHRSQHLLWTGDSGRMWPTCHWPAQRLPTWAIWLLHGKRLGPKGPGCQRWEARTQNKVHHLLDWQRTGRRPVPPRSPEAQNPARRLLVVPGDPCLPWVTQKWLGGQESYKHDPFVSESLA